MKRMIAVFIVVLMLLVGGGCAKQESTFPQSNQMSQSHQEFQQKKYYGQIAFSICGCLVICGVLFKIGAIVTGFISGHRLGKKVRKAKEAKAKEAWRQEMTDYQRETLRHKEYMEERMRQKRKSLRPK